METSQSLFTDLYMLNRADQEAIAMSGCAKVVVGALIIDTHQRHVYGANVTNAGQDCKGLSACQHDGHCTNTLHAEIHAIIKARTNLFNTSIYVTRYPCDNCARAIIAAGIKTVVYGRGQRISKIAEDMFKSSRVTVRHIKEFKEDE